MKEIINSILNNFGYKLEKRKAGLSDAEGYPQYLEESRKLNLDVNDYLDNNLGWIKPLPVLEKVFFPLLDKITSPEILELGPGTGRWTRYILKKAKEISITKYCLVDHSQWMIEFLRSYFKDEHILDFMKNNGVSLPLKDSQFNIIFSQGVIIELKPSYVYLYAKEFSRVLKTGGYCVFDYFNYDSDEGWKYFIDESNKGNIFYTFFSDRVIDKIFEKAGLVLKERYEYGKATFAVFKKTG